MPRPRRLFGLLVLAAVGCGVLVPALAPAGAAADAALSGRGWIWPVSAFRVVAPYVQPAHRYGPGHRGIDLEAVGSVVVVAPADGVIAFAGTVADRPLVTVDHGEGLVTTLEPVTSSLAPGAEVRRGEPVGELGLGGHTAPGALHFGVRLNGEYVNPLLLLGGIPRAVLLPCCD